MKHGRRLTRKQKLYLAAQGLDPRDWLVVKDTSTEIEFVHRVTKELKIFGKGETDGAMAIHAKAEPTI